MQTITSSPSQPEPYRSRDQRVEICVHQNPDRWPRHHYPCIVIRLSPTNHERVRFIGTGKVEYMPTLEEIKSLLKYLRTAHPDLDFANEKQLVNKPEERKFYWKKVNHDRVRSNYRRGRWY